MKKEDTKRLIRSTRESIKSYLLAINRMEGDVDTSMIQIYKWFVIREKCIYSSLNKLEARGTFLRGEFWVPDKYRPMLSASMDRIRSN